MVRMIVVCFQMIAILFSPDSLQARTDSCISLGCHRPFGVLKNLHYPLNNGKKCFECHVRVAQYHPVKGVKAHELIAQNEKLCYGCHESFGKRKVVHEPVRKGECTSCHNPHGSNGRSLLDITDSDTPLCVKCHDAATFEQAYQHGPVAVGACGKCHDPHESANVALLREPPRDNCLKCHADFANGLKESAIVHAPVRDDPCTACHTPHGSRFSHMLKKETKELCLGCHEAFGKKLSSMKVIHKPISQEDACISCHAPHYSKAKGLLPGDEKGVCLGCHGTDRLGIPPLRNIKKEIEGKKVLHGPLQHGECKACHDPHGSKYFRMLRGEYPSALYAPYREGIYDACLNCHEKNLLRYPDTTVFTQFRNGKNNLHYVHVANKRKGRTCRVCHEPHASTGDKLINKESMQFGEWKIPVNLTMTPTGGKCAPGCHKAFKYDREVPETYKR